MLIFIICQSELNSVKVYGQMPGEVRKWNKFATKVWQFIEKSSLHLNIILWISLWPLKGKARETTGILLGSTWNKKNYYLSISLKFFDT